MDPQKLSQLDPKLREAYQRVMGTSIPQPKTSPIQTQASPPAGGPQPVPVPDPTPSQTPVPEPEPTPSPVGKSTLTIEELSNKLTEPIPTPQPSIPQPDSEPQPTIPQPEPPPPGGPIPQPSISREPEVKATNFDQMNSEVAAAPSQNFTAPTLQAQTITLKKKNRMMIPVLFGIIGLIFIVIYTLFWTKIFNLNLPFLPF